MATDLPYVERAAEGLAGYAPVDVPNSRSRLARAELLADLMAPVGLAGGLLLVGMLVPALGGTSLPTLILAFGLSIPVVFGLLGMYGSDPIEHSATREARQAAGALMSLLALWLIGALVVAPESVGRAEAIEALGAVPIIYLTVLALRAWSRNFVGRLNPERVLIVGAGRVGQQVAHGLRGNRSGTVEVVGFMDDDPSLLTDDFSHLPVFPETNGLGRAVEATRATRLLLAFSRRSPEETLDVLRQSRAGALPISVVPRLHEITPSHAAVGDIGGMPVINLTGTRLSWTARLAKRSLDVALATFGLMLLTPIFLIIAIAIKFESPGPVFFRQDRMGFRGRHFRIVKFRTMHRDAEAKRLAMAHLNEMADPGPLFKMDFDPRVTRVGRFLRRTSIDELPQLLNVLSGTMSLVGPRPFVIHEAEKITGWGSRRLDLIPGMTGLWQSRGRNDIAFDEMVRLDYLYVTNWSLWWDIRIMMETIPAVLGAKGAK